MKGFPFALCFINNHIKTNDNLLKYGIISHGLSIHVNGYDLEEN